MMKQIAACFSIELLKVRRAMIFRVTIGAACFIPLILGLMMVLIKNPDVLPPGILKTKIGLAAVSADWPSYIGFTEMAASAIGMVLFGFNASWIFGREFNDRTVKDLLALPVSRSIVVVSKILAVWVWCVFLGIIMFALSMVVGLLVGLPLWSPDLVYGFIGVFSVIILLSLLLCPPVAFIASAGRSYLPAIGFVILCLGLANLFANIGLGEYFPWTIPMVYAGAVGTSGNTLSAVSGIIMLLTCLAGILGTIRFWRHADQSR
jgi:ABC-2 type transport system permease protein